MVFLIGINLVAPKVADVTGLFGSWAANACTIESSSSITDSKRGTFIIASNTCHLESNDENEPINYGAPDSQHGSGTR
ncbi:MAG: hypothetical protein KME64_25325 [Scytonematopsis contorta HA4267-MV1]|nr:hypothetical protein [Scytonematopsis contorta HA4267-MV1]